MQAAFGRLSFGLRSGADRRPPPTRLSKQRNDSWQSGADSGKGNRRHDRAGEAGLNALTGLREMMPAIGHVQIASVALRNEPGTGELDDFRILRELESLGYTGFVG